MPASPATGTPRVGLAGTNLRSAFSESSVAMTPASSTPPTRNGIDWTTIATKIVLHVASAGESRRGTSHCCDTTSAPSTPKTT
jgi:hypothetical protein